MNRVDAWLYSAGLLLPDRVATLEVPGRRTGRPVSVPLVVAHHDGERYLVSMLGEDAGWVRNVRAAGGRAVLRHGRRETVRLIEVEAGARAPILRRYLAVAPGARAHLPVDRDAPPSEFERVAADVPVFCIAPATTPRARFAIRYDPVLQPLFTAFGMGPGTSHATVTADELHAVMGWAFRARIARNAVLDARPARTPLILGIGVHGWAGRWAVNGSRAGAVRLEVDPPARAHVCGVPVRLRTLWLSLVDPDGFLAALAAPGVGAQQTTGTREPS
jgi:deazaflavin-dependent oxidoreductase (nitroreductase family)